MAGDLRTDVQIRTKLERFCRQTETRNSRGMFDLTRQGEDLVCRLLNLAMGWELVNLNRIRPNCPAVDLADETRGVCVQVTGSRSGTKAASTQRLLRKYYGDRYARLVIFYLLGKPRKPILLPAESVQTEVWDMEDLAAALSETPEAIQQEALAFLCAIEDSGILEQQADLAAEDREFCPSQEILEGGDQGQALLVCQEKRVRLVAFLPRAPDRTLSCKLEFARRDTVGSHITFEQTELEKHLFSGHHGPLEQRAFVHALDEQQDFAALQLGNCRYFTDVDTVRQTARVLDTLQENYERERMRLSNLLGTVGFSVPPEKDWTQALCRMPKQLWHQMLLCLPSCRLGDAEIDVRSERLVNLLRTERPDGLAAQLIARMDGEICTILWRRGFVFPLEPWEGYDQGILWKADWTLAWILEQWLPVTADILYRKNRPFGPIRWVLTRMGCCLTQKAYRQWIFDQVHSLKSP